LVKAHPLFRAGQKAYGEALDHLCAVTKSLSEITAERDSLRASIDGVPALIDLRDRERRAIGERDEARTELGRVCDAYEKADARIEGLLGEINKLAQDAEHYKAKASEAESGLAAVRAERDALAEGVGLLRAPQWELVGDKLAAWQRKHGHLA
jgi:chromosome segregation ATPase